MLLKLSGRVVLSIVCYVGRANNDFCSDGKYQTIFNSHRQKSSYSFVTLIYEDNKTKLLQPIHGENCQGWERTYLQNKFFVCFMVKLISQQFCIIQSWTLLGQFNRLTKGSLKKKLVEFVSMLKASLRAWGPPCAISKHSHNIRFEWGNIIEKYALPWTKSPFWGRSFSKRIIFILG